MPRPRFARLDGRKRDAILDAAAAEFGEHGFDRASYNRIIERAGLSKGAMYYYFDDKQDLFVTVLTEAADQLKAALRSPGDPPTVEAFWADIEKMSFELMASLGSKPRLTAILPALLNVWSAPEPPTPLRDVREQFRVWVNGFLRVGRGVGAVRSDVPDDLLVAVILAMGEAMDTWLIARWVQDPQTAEDFDASIRLMVGLLRRVVAPGP